MLYSHQFREDILRSLAGRSQRDVAEKAGVSQTTISNWQRGQLPPNLDMVRRYAIAVGENPDAWVERVRKYAISSALRKEYELTEQEAAEVERVLDDILERRMKRK